MIEKLTDLELKDLSCFCNQVRLDVVGMIYNAKSGHPGGCLSAVEILSVLYKKCLKNYPDWVNNPHFKERDRFILSKGHASATLYSVLAHCGYFPVDELMTFRKFGSRLQGHPSCRHLSGIEVSTGSLGQGLSMACGVALGLRLDKNPANIVAYLGDGELQEGSVWEAAMNAAHYKLSNLIAFVDRNNLQIDSCTENIKQLDSIYDKFKAFNWNVFEIDGHDLNSIYETYQKAKQIEMPSVIIANTVKGKGVSFMENNVGWHGKAPSAADYETAISELRGALC